MRRLVRAAEVSFRSGRVGAFRRRPFRPLATGARHGRAKQQAARFGQCATNSKWRCFGCQRREIHARTAGGPPRAAGARKATRKRKLLAGVLDVAVLAVLLVSGIPWVEEMLNTVSTDDAFVKQEGNLFTRFFEAASAALSGGQRPGQLP
jgi:hypothetical protein